MKKTNYIVHSGVRGMKWGIRKDKGSSGRKKKANVSSDHSKARKLEKQGPKKLSNQELSELNKRLQLEQSYRKAKAEKNVYKRGVNFVRAVTAGGAAVAALYGLSKTPLYKDVKLAIDLHAIQNAPKVAKVVEDFVI